VDVVDCRKNGPHAVDLAPVPVDFGDDEEDWEEREGECEAGDDRVGRGVDIFQGLGVSEAGDDLVRQGVQLRDVRLDRLAVGSAVGERLDHGHGDAGIWCDEHVGGVDDDGSSVNGRVEVSKCFVVSGDVADHRRLKLPCSR
jgi:hypothetical protein